VKRLRSLFAAALVLAAFPSAALASPTQESMFQDDPLLVYGTPEGVESTLNLLSEFGVDRIRVSVFWQNLAPANDQVSKPAFEATDPAAYPPKHWEPYDRLIRSAQSKGILVNLNFTSPIPRWAAGQSPDAAYQNTFQPNPKEFGDFVRAVSARYSGTYMGLPRVDYWSIWNEPNQAGWLTPQWAPDPRDASKQVEASPAIYRNLVREAWTALADTGHGTDTILVGETAPAGQKRNKGISQSIDALRFIRQLYCLDDNLNTFKGQEAEVRGCPVAGGGQFVAENQGLFKAKGFAHHPYEQLRQPDKVSSWPDWVTMANLKDLSAELRRIYQRYGQPLQTRRGVPLYLTEYGYQTKPDPFTISFARQATWLNQAEYIAYKNKNVRAFSQFLLVDDAPVPGVSVKTEPRLAWRTFQSGLVLQTGKRKPSYKAYVTPLFVKERIVRHSRGAGVFGMLRGAKSPRVRTQVQWRQQGRKRWRTLRTVTVAAPRHYLEVRVRVPRTGSLRLRWNNGRRAVVSRTAPVVVRR